MPDYLICIDFEATCYPSRYQRNKGWYQEILEFGAVLIKLSNGEIESAFQSHVRPTEFYLTRGCYKKLNICQETIDKSLALPAVLTKFGRWVRGIRDDYDLVMPWHGRDSDENTYFCTWSNMDLGYYLPNECEKKDISYANYLKWWINGQEIFQNAYGRIAKLHDAAFAQDTLTVGDAHAALDDAKTLAFLVTDMWHNTSFDFHLQHYR